MARGIFLINGALAKNGGSVHLLAISSGGARLVTGVASWVSGGAFSTKPIRVAGHVDNQRGE